MKEVAVYEAKTRLSELLAEVEKGEQFVITRRGQAIARMRIALSEMVVSGIKTNIPLHRDLLTDASFLRGGASIHYLEQKLALHNKSD